MNKYEKLLMNCQYEEAANLASVDIKSGAGTASAYYAYYLARNNDYVCFERGNANDEMYLAKALELAKPKEKVRIENEKMLYENLGMFPNLDKVFRMVYYKQYTKARELLDAAILINYPINNNGDINVLEKALEYYLNESRVNEYLCYESVVSYMIYLNDALAGLATKYDIPRFEYETEKNESEEKKDTSKTEIATDPNSKSIVYGFKVGDRIKFGSYKNDDLVWRVLDLKDDRALIITNEIIEMLPFHDKKQRLFQTNKYEFLKNNNYEMSSIRRWLNHDFYSCFSRTERKLVLKTQLDNSVESTLDAENIYICHDTNDYIFLLSRFEAEKYFKDHLDRKTSATPRVRLRGISVTEEKDKDGKLSCYWHLRTPYKENPDRVCGVYYSGGNVGNCSIDDKKEGVRPAMWIKISVNDN